MIMWITALALVVLTAGIGYRAGATRAAISFIGLLVAAALAIPFGPMFTWIFPIFGYTSPLVGKFFAPILAFFAMSFVFKGIAAFVHRKIEYYYRYDRDDAHRAVWEVMHRRVGACVGSLNGIVYFMVFALGVAVFGYTTIQIGSGDNDSRALSWLGKSAEDLQATHMDKVVASFNPAPDRYFDTSDTLGLLYHNRGLIDRLEKYPTFAAMAQKPTYKALGKDRELQNLIRSKSSFPEIFANASVQEAVTNTDLVARIMEIDILDLRQYLETGVSPKFEKERILGHWRYNALDTIHLIRDASNAQKKDWLASVWSKLKNELTERFEGSVFSAYSDNYATFRLATNMEGRATAYVPTPMRLPNGRVVTNQVPRWANTNAQYSALGVWSVNSPFYFVSLTNKLGGGTVEGKVVGDRLVFPALGFPLTFDHVSE